MSDLIMHPSVERIGDQPYKAEKDYRTRFSDLCVWTDDLVDWRFGGFQGRGIAPERHPLERQFAMLRVFFIPCGRCRGTNVSVIYAYFTCPPSDPAPGEVLFGYEIVCTDCQAYTYRHYEH